MTSRSSLFDLPLFAHHSTDAVDLIGHAFKLVHHIVKGVGHFTLQAHPIVGKPHGKLAFFQTK